MSSSRIPLYRVKGTHYECGYAIGKLAHGAIRQRIADDLDTLPALFAFVQNDHGNKLYQDFVETTRLLYPWYWDEIRGLADGSEIPLEQILVLNFLNETRTAYRLTNEAKQLIENEQILENETGEKGCTTVLINRKDTNTLSILHNEDHSRTLYTTAYLVEADIQSSKYDNDKRESPNEKYIAYCYAGSVPGNAFSVNVHGFAYAVDGLYPNFVAQDRLPRQIVNRALLAVRNEDDLDKLLHLSPVAHGFCVNGGFIHQPTYLLNYEIGPNINSDKQNYVSKCRIINNEQNIEKNNEDCIALNYNIHYNHYERLNDVISQQKSLQSSYSRWQRGQELGELFNANDALCLLGDQENKLFPIFRASSEVDANSVTLCTIHINFMTLELIIYEHNPKSSSQSSYIYNLTNILC